MSLLSDKYTQFSIKDFLIIFPGKSIETLKFHIENFQKRDAQNSESVLTKVVKNEEITIDERSSISTSFISDKQISIHLNSIKDFSSLEYLKSLDKRDLKRLSYSIKQAIGQLYAKIEA